MNEVFVAKRGDRTPTHPGAVLREDVMPALGMNVKQLANRLDIGRQQLHRILSGDSGISPEMALRLGRLCGNGPDLWINMQVARDLYRAKKALGLKLEAIEPMKEMA